MNKFVWMLVLERRMAHEQILWMLILETRMTHEQVFMDAGSGDKDGS